MKNNTINNTTIAYTHSGIFHSDDVFCGALLQLLYNNIVIKRVYSITKQQLSDHIVFDIGGGKYDHHTEPKLRDTGELFSSFGLLFEDLGREFIAKFTDKVEDVFCYIVNNYVKVVDFVDNNGKQYNELKEITLIRNMNMDFSENEEINNIYYEEAVQLAKIFLSVWVRKAIANFRIAEAAAQWNKEKASAKNGVVVLSKFLPFKKFNCDKVNFVIAPSLRGGYNLLALGAFHIEPCQAPSATFVHQNKHMASFDTIAEARQTATAILHIAHHKG